jgi:putative (di)nucleoside polyphosphate hydrolase
LTARPVTALKTNVPPPSSSRRSPADRYRPCVAAVLQNDAGMILICERRDFSDSWQFPQGGIDAGETPREALVRELMEEISLPPEGFEIKTERPGYKYHFPERHRKRGKFVGQEQVYFLCQFIGPESLLNLETEHPEFRRWKWILPHEFDLRWLPEFKREVYQQVLRDFFEVEIH